jgi:hypothetical protein
MYIEVEVIEERHEDASVNPRYGHSASTRTHYPVSDNLRLRPSSFVNHTSLPPPPPPPQITNKQRCVNEYNALTTVNPPGGDVVCLSSLYNDGS